MNAPTLHLGDCLDVLRTLPDASVHAIVTDPPYGLSFMGRKWDYDVPSVDIWRECLRALKPGGHLLAFAGTRTQHRMAVNIEDAGFEIRDMIAWVYGSGFPKSMDISKAIDRVDASEEQKRRRLRFTAWVRSTGVTSRQIDQATGTKMGSHYTTHPTQPAIMTREHLEQCRHLLGNVPDWVEREADIRSVESKNMASREVVGRKEMLDTTKARAGFFGPAHSPGYDGSKRMVDITAPATSEAQQWAGWGTALKPALEPITVARKPLQGTVAANVLEHGCGGLNVDGCRVEMGCEYDPIKVQRQQADTGGQITRKGAFHSWVGKEIPTYKPGGRWPANLIHDGSDEATIGLAESARYFYTAKASASERQGVTHPTVKPLDLMAYLVRLVTPPGGTVLDPFMGSGTTIKAALSEGFHAIGIEREPEYFAMAEQRLNGAQIGLPLAV